MKTDQRTPSEIINNIGDIIREREQKKIPTFYTICIDQYGQTTPVLEKEEGYENFKLHAMKYMSDYNLDALLIQLFSGKSRNVKTAFQTFKVPLKKQNPNIVFSGVDKNTSSEVQQLDSSIPVSRYYDEKFEYQMRIMRLENDIQRLTDRIVLLTERNEDKLKDQELKNTEIINNLEDQIKELEEEIKDYEKEIVKNEKDKHNSLGNVTLGGIGSKLIEGFVKSRAGQGVLKGFLGDAGFETLQGHLAGIETEKKENNENTDARIISEPETVSTDPREVALNYIRKVGENLTDLHLRMLYDISEATEKTPKDLEIIWKVLQQIIQQRSTPVKQTAAAPPEASPEQE